MQEIRRILGLKVARGGLATAVTLVTFASVGVPRMVSATPISSEVAAAEAVAGPFVEGFESQSSPNARPLAELKDAATPDLAWQLDTPSQAGAGSADPSSGLVVDASVDGFQVASSEAGVVDLLARTQLSIDSGAGVTTTYRLVPVRVVSTPAGWLVAGIDGLVAAPQPAAAPLEPGLPPVPAEDPASAAAAEASPAPAPSDGAPQSTSAFAGDVAVADIPLEYVHLFVGAAATCPGLPWSVLAGIGKVESNFGRSTLPGVSSGANFAGAEGPMQFLPSTFKAVATVGPGGAVPPNPYDPADAVYSAAKLLCWNGAGDPAHLYSAIYNYNHSAAYVNLVLAYSAKYAAAAALLTGGTGDGNSALASMIISYARSYLGTPYVWGGESPSGFDCSGLVQWVFAKAGLSLPRVAQDQYNAGPKLPARAELLPGDLVFFGDTTGTIHHVGLYIGGGQMIDAPHTGAVVRIEAVGSYIGATRPAIPDLANGSDIPVVLPAPGAGSGSTGAPPARKHRDVDAPILADGAPARVGAPRTDRTTTRHRTPVTVTPPTTAPTKTTRPDAGRLTSRRWWSPSTTTSTAPMSSTTTPSNSLSTGTPPTTVATRWSSAGSTGSAGVTRTTSSPTTAVPTTTPTTAPTRVAPPTSAPAPTTSTTTATRSRWQAPSTTTTTAVRQTTTQRRSTPTTTAASAPTTSSSRTSNRSRTSR
jgi:cell wall-associated NlpC family hydrolase